MRSPPSCFECHGTTPIPPHHESKLCTAITLDAIESPFGCLLAPTRQCVCHGAELKGRVHCTLVFAETKGTSTAHPRVFHPYASVSPRGTTSPVLVQGFLLDSEGILPQGVKHVVTHRRHGILPCFEIHHDVRHLRVVREENGDSDTTRKSSSTSLYQSSQGARRCEKLVLDDDIS